MNVLWVSEKQHCGTMTRPKKEHERRRATWTQDDMMKAYKAKTECGMSIRQAAKKYGVPKSSLEDRLTGRVDVNAPIGGPTTFNKDEEKLMVQWLFEMQEIGYPITKKE
jgi:hypothetical protein